MSRLHSTARWRQCGSSATKLNRLDACEDRNVDGWCRTKASGHSGQGVFDDRIYEAGASTTAPDRCALLLNEPGIRWLFTTLLRQHPSPNQQAASKYDE